MLSINDEIPDQLFYVYVYLNELGLSYFDVLQLENNVQQFNSWESINFPRLQNVKN